MDGRTQGALLLAVGGVSIRLALTDAVLNYLRPEYVPFLVASGVVLLIFGAITLLQALRESGDDHDHLVDPSDPDGSGLTHPLVQEIESEHGVDHGHDHGKGPRVAWMMAAPLFAILLIAPPPLGSYAANRQSGVIQTTSSVFPPLPPQEAGAVPLTLSDYTVRALYDTEQSLAGERVRMVGFVSRAVDDGQGDWVLTRFAMSCCAADGTAINVAVVDGGPAPPVDQWVEVEGVWQARDDHEIGTLTADPPLLVADSVRLVDQPTEPYEF